MNIYLSATKVIRAKKFLQMNPQKREAYESYKDSVDELRKAIWNGWENEDEKKLGEPLLLNLKKDIIKF